MSPVSDPDPAAPPAAPRPASRVEQLRGRAEALGEQLARRRDEARAALPPVDIGLSAVEHDNRIGGFIVAGAIAFRLFVYVLPLYLLGLVIAGAAFSVDPDSPDALARDAGMSTYLRGTVGEAAATSHKSLWILIPVTLYALASAGLSAHKAIAAAHTSAWNLPARPKVKPYVVAPLFFAFAIVVGMAALAFGRLRETPVGIVVMVLAGATYGGLWLAASLLLPRARAATWWHLLPGAVLVGAGTQALYLFNVLYLNHKIETASQAYGALGVAASALLWLYLLGRLLVAAPVLNATLWERTRPPEPAEPEPAEPA